MVLPNVSSHLGAVFRTSTPFTAIPRLEVSTRSPAHAITGFMRGDAPSGQFPFERYPRTAAKEPNGSAGQNSTKPDWSEVSTYRPRGSDGEALILTPSIPINREVPRHVDSAVAPISFAVL
jgi:hypothetical protein